MSQYIDQAVADLVKLIKIESIEGNFEPSAPFGASVRAALDAMYQSAKRLGFTPHDVDGYAGFCEWTTGHRETVGILTHLDVVPIGEGWTRRQGECADGKIFGRGAADDKGPAVAVLYALKKLRDEGFCPTRNIRLIWGCNEETGSRCMDEYQRREGMPTLGFTPDSDFPIVQFEKTILHMEIDLPLPDPILDWTAGSRPNVVPDKSVVVLSTKIPDAVPQENGYAHTDHGKSAHAQMPALGENAIWHTAKILREIPGCESLNPLFALCSPDAEKILGIELQDEGGTQTINIGMLRTHGRTLTVTLDLRCPLTADLQQIKRNVAAHFDAPLRILYEAPYLYADPNGELFQKLYGVWVTKTQQPLTPVVSGGGTYARHMTCGVAFGPYLPDEDNRIHDSDEFIRINHLDFLIEIYADAIRELAK